MRLPSALFGPKIPLEQLAQFCGNLATCVSAGLDIPKSLQTCQRSAPSAVLREILPTAAEGTARGMSLFTALELRKDCFPRFFLPVLRCGEESGHTDEALRYLEVHCRLLAGPARIMRNTWLVPLCLMLAGTGVCAVGYLALAPFTTAMRYIFDSLQFYLVVLLVAGTVLCVPALKALLDYVKLVIPLIGPAERELSLNRFFHALHLLYAAGGRRVEKMIRLAADAAENRAMRADFLRAAKVVQSGGTIGAAFSALASLPFTYKAIIATGDEAGKLETAFETICHETAESVQLRLAGFQQVFFRVVAAAVISSITMTFYALTLMRH